jgi:deoxyadenosine/deoxycytidine kinase
MTNSPHGRPLIGVVGPCGAGKSTLIAGLAKEGHSARHIAQEHSYVPDMWKRITNPDLLIYLMVSYPNTIKRRKLNWTISEFEEQIKRLEHAYTNADLIIDTNQFSIDDVLDKVHHFVEEWMKKHMKG